MLQWKAMTGHSIPKLTFTNVQLHFLSTSTLFSYHEVVFNRARDSNFRGKFSKVSFLWIFLACILQLFKSINWTLKKVSKIYFLILEQDKLFRLWSRFWGLNHKNVKLQMQASGTSPYSLFRAVVLNLFIAVAHFHFENILMALYANFGKRSNKL